MNKISVWPKQKRDPDKPTGLDRPTNNPKRAARLEMIRKAKAQGELNGLTWDSKQGKCIDPNNPTPIEQIHKVGGKGDRYGWSRSIELELAQYSPEERAWRQMVLERDGFACVFCKSRNRLEADHIKPKALYPDLRFDVQNGRTLCHDCHVKTETYGRKVHRIVAISVDDAEHGPK